MRMCAFVCMHSNRGIGVVFLLHIASLGVKKGAVDRMRNKKRLYILTFLQGGLENKASSVVLPADLAAPFAAEQSRSLAEKFKDLASSFPSGSDKLITLAEAKYASAHYIKPPLKRG